MVFLQAISIDRALPLGALEPHGAPKCLHCGSAMDQNGAEQGSCGLTNVVCTKTAFFHLHLIHKNKIKIKTLRSAVLILIFFVFVFHWSGPLRNLQQQPVEFILDWKGKNGKLK